MLLVVVEAVYEPVGVVVDRTTDEYVELIVFEAAVFELRVKAFLSYVTGLVAVYDVAYAEFLILPVGVGSGCVVGGEHTLS